MTKLKLSLLVLVVGGGAIALLIEHQTEARLRQEIQSLQQQMAQLQEENASLANRAARAKWDRAPRLPAPAMPVTVQTSASPTEDAPATNLYARFKDQAPKLTPGQVKAYLKANGRKASSLLAAYRTSGDPALLKEAMEKYPKDPRVAFEAVMDKDMSPEQQREWLNAFKQGAPDNALANYLSARDYIKAGQMDQAVQELTAASGKPQFQDYTTERVQDDQEAYLSAGYSPAESERIALSWLELPQLPQMKQLGRDVVALAGAYSQAGDQASAQAALQMAVNLGQRYGNGPPNAALISQLVGLAVERMALNAMDPNSPYDASGQTVQGRLNEITQQRSAVDELVQKAQPLLPTLSDQEMLNYENRRMLFGEVAALQWVASRYGQK
jgi:hypothetical protein